MKSYKFYIKVPTELGTASVTHTIEEVATLDEALTKVKASLAEAYGDNYKIFHYEEVKQ
jgi:predicted RNase H-like HicB family nuclease